MTIANLSDLYVLFGAESFADLNRQVYKDTSCGASISIYGTLPTSEVDPQELEKRRCAYLCNLLEAEYQRILPLLTEAYHRASVEDRVYFLLVDGEFSALSDPHFPQAEFLANKLAPFVAWARSIVTGAFPVTDVVVPDRIPVAYPNGHRDPIPASFVLTGFTIQTTVEGSDAEVNSDVFPLGTTKAEVDAWIEEMERQADHLWREADGEGENTEND